MIIETRSWHYRTMVWAYGWDYFYDKYTGARKPVALCPYVDRLVIAVLTSPFIAFWRLLTDDAKIFAVITSMGLVYGVLGYFTLGWIAFPIAVSGTWLLVGIVVGLNKFWEYWKSNHPSKPKEKKPKAEKPRKERKPKGPRKPNIIWEWLKARHRKICPYLQFDDGMISA